MRKLGSLAIIAIIAISLVALLCGPDANGQDGLTPTWTLGSPRPTATNVSTSPISPLPTPRPRATQTPVVYHIYLPVVTK